MLTAFHAVARSFNRARMSIVFGAGVRAPPTGAAPGSPVSAASGSDVLPRAIGGASDDESMPSVADTDRRARGVSTGAVSFTSTDSVVVPSEWRFKDVEKM